MTESLAFKADLHCHSTASDGVLAPAEVAARAHANGVTLWSLTDHDEISGIPQASQAASSLGMQFVSGIEISVSWAERTLHVVGLNIDIENSRLNQGLEQIRRDRETRAHLMADKLAELGITGSYEGALSYAGNPNLLSRTHFARYLVEQGYCKTMQEVFDRYLADGKPAYVAGEWAGLDEALDWIHAAGGIAVIAHPGRYKYSRREFTTLFRTFKLMGARESKWSPVHIRPISTTSTPMWRASMVFWRLADQIFIAPRKAVWTWAGYPPCPVILYPYGKHSTEIMNKAFVKEKEDDDEDDQSPEAVACRQAPAIT
ncbi:PHP domain-containing protein [Advenella kashmirensis WT001]|uniref:PHP domain-containing protein n=1 Tax=Advenella kashmirensis (strain DSM 17095 / LMG 22695 / WT001) TaxID=1036672 RepID=I3UBS6_ADVKW|nr:PHP domain-containing protein [Advenella kashmirensis WT001]